MIAEILVLSCLGSSWGYLYYDYYYGEFSTRGKTKKNN